MVSRLESLFRSTFRPAAPTDSWMGIRREEAQHERKDKNSDRHEDDEFDRDDSTDLSVAALRQFLESLFPPHAPQPVAPPPTEMPYPDQKTAAAIHAYQSTARVPAPATPVPPPESAQLSPVETATILAVLDDLNHLEQVGVETLTLRPESGELFLDSIVRAVRVAGTSGPGPERE